MSGAARLMETEEAGRARWLYMRARVAVAMAVIKAKPPGASGRDHCEALSRGLRRLDRGWRNKARGLQQEVLRLRQELLITTVTSNTRSSSQVTEDNMDALSQDLFSPGSLVSCAGPQLDCDSETPDLLLQDPPVLPPPPGPCGGPGGSSLRPHVHFLLSLCALQRAECSGGAEARFFGPDGTVGSVTADTVCHLLRCVVAACRDPPAPGLPPDLVLRACQVASRALELLCAPRRPSVELMRRVEEPLKELIQTLLLSKRASRAAGRMVEYLVALGSSRILKSFVIRHIVSEISSVADQLLQASQEASGLEVFPVDRYQNSCHLLWILEVLLQNSEVPLLPGNASIVWTEPAGRHGDQNNSSGARYR
ncbi:meiosis-specific protein MEI4 isoform X2 [Austrofundulus limnaeus]|uniref:Meiosis-specific protein MEI4 isoform X2 n=1 Tax=Austrofundulus limnaeus TaxID=52670 RepID=A0A2I4C0B4_AUSLI|nr:PREDICTED: meiosis-specific protein MEI4-like isoform X2 [Austrofundulus limnaeus]